MAITENLTVIGLAVGIVLSGLCYWAGNRLMKQISILEMVQNFMLTHGAIHAALEKDVSRIENDMKRVESDLKRQMDKMEGKMDQVIHEIDRIKK